MLWSRCPYPENRSNGQASMKPTLAIAKKCKWTFSTLDFNFLSKNLFLIWLHWLECQGTVTFKWLLNLLDVRDCGETGFTRIIFLLTHMEHITTLAFFLRLAHSMKTNCILILMTWDHILKESALPIINEIEKKFKCLVARPPGPK